jgi:hypothetical protein
MRSSCVVKSSFPQNSCLSQSEMSEFPLETVIDTMMTEPPTWTQHSWNSCPTYQGEVSRPWTILHLLSKTHTCIQPWGNLRQDHTEGLSPEDLALNLHECRVTAVRKRPGTLWADGDRRNMMTTQCNVLSFWAHLFTARTLQGQLEAPMGSESWSCPLWTALLGCVSLCLYHV